MLHTLNCATRYSCRGRRRRRQDTRDVLNNLLSATLAPAHEPRTFFPPPPEHFVSRVHAPAAAFDNLCPRQGLGGRQAPPRLKQSIEFGRSATSMPILDSLLNSAKRAPLERRAGGANRYPRDTCHIGPHASFDSAQTLLSVMSLRPSPCAGRRPSLAELVQIRTDVGQGLAKSRPILADVNLDRTSPNFGQLLPTPAKSGQTRSDFGQHRPTVAEFRRPPAGSNSRCGGDQSGKRFSPTCSRSRCALCRCFWGN